MKPVGQMMCIYFFCSNNGSAADVAQSVYPHWDVNSMDLPTKGQYEPPILIADGTEVPSQYFILVYHATFMTKTQNKDYTVQDIFLLFSTFSTKDTHCQTIS